MNNKGQILVLFLLLMPVIIIFICFVIDSSIMYYEKNKLDSINNDILISIKDKNVKESEIKRLINLNDDDIKINRITIDKDKIIIEDEKEIDSIFGKFINKDSYLIKSETSIKRG